MSPNVHLPSLYVFSYSLSFSTSVVITDLEDSTSKPSTVLIANPVLSHHLSSMPHTWWVNEYLTSLHIVSISLSNGSENSDSCNSQYHPEPLYVSITAIQAFVNVITL